MRMVSFPLAITVFLCVCASAWGQQAWSDSQVQQLVRQLTRQPRKTWISVGTITAKHQEYGAPKVTDSAVIRREIDKAVQQYQNSSNKIERTAELQQMKLDAMGFNVRYRLANEYTMSSTVTVKYDNGQFYWEINVDSRRDSVQPDAALAGNKTVHRFDLRWNQRRVFTWDGQEYRLYNPSGNHALVDAADKMPHVITGPLTAGLIPWGYGGFSADALAAAQIAAQQNADGTINMIVTRDDGSSARLTLDPAQGYAVTKATLTRGGGATTTYTCSGYRQVAGNWVPSTVTIERRDGSWNNRLPTAEQWTFTSISATAPTPDSFRVALAPNTVVEYSSPVTASSAVYVQSSQIDTHSLLAQRLAFAAAAGKQPQNCATAALQEVATEFGKSVPDSALAGLVGPDGRTSMYDMKRLAESQGLFCQAVSADPATLRTLPGVKAILHLPGKDHFVVLSEADERNAWVIDLSNKKFCYRQSIDSLLLHGSGGAALLLSDRPLPGRACTLSDALLTDIAGGDGWACNVLLQSRYTWICDTDGPAICGGALIFYFERWGCGPADSGDCSQQSMEFWAESICDKDTYGNCEPTGNWYSGYDQACQ